MEILLIITVFLILGAEFVNGWTDAPNSIVTIVSTRTLSLRKSIVLATLLNIAGAMSGTAVAATIGKGIVRPETINLTTVAAAMIAIILWSSIAYRKGLPTSESHALIAGLSGAALATSGFDVILWSGWQKVILGLIFSTFLGFGSAFLMTKAVRIASTNFPRASTRKFFGKFQIISASFMAFSHGSNDGQKFIGVFALALVLGGILQSFTIPFWVIISCAVVMGLGTSFGGWRIIKTMGFKMVELETYQGFSAETSAAATIIAASHFGIPLSTTHTIGTSLVGTGLANSKKALRIGVLKNITLAWILTFPICGLIAFTITKILQLLF